MKHYFSYRYQYKYVSRHNLCGKGVIIDIFTTLKIIYVLGNIQHIYQAYFCMIITCIHTYITYLIYTHVLDCMRDLRKLCMLNWACVHSFFLVGKRKQKKSFSSNGYTLTINYNHIFELVSVLKFFNVCCLVKSQARVITRLI